MKEARLDLSDLSAAADVASMTREAARLRLSALDQVMAAEFGHLGSCMSCAEIVAGAFQVFDLSAGDHEGSDLFVLSKGHAVPMLYAATTRAPEAIPFAVAGSRFPGHPNAMISPNVIVSTGSVGMGLAIGVGLAAGLELQARPGRVIVVAGDGEMQAGMIWETILNIAARPALPILFVIDANGYQGQMAVATNRIVRRMLESAVPEFRAIDGNDPRSVLEVMHDFAAAPRVMVVWAETRRGAGVPILERNPLPMTWRPEPNDVEGIRSELRAAL
jgi:transketolase